MRLTQVSPAVAEPLHLTEVKLHLRLAVNAADAVLYTAEDDQLPSLVAVARQVAETETWQTLVLQIWDFFLDTWPASRELSLPLPPLRKVEFIRYTDSLGVVTTLPESVYTVDTDSVPGRVVLNYGETWPGGTLATKNPIQIRFRCGFVTPFTAAADTDILTALGHTYSDGDRVRVSVSGGALPTGLQALTDYYVRDVSGNTLKLSATEGGAAVNLTTAGSGTLFLGVLPPAIQAGMKLVLTDLHENRGEVVLERYVTPALLPRAATHFFSMASAKRF